MKWILFAALSVSMVACASAHEPVMNEPVDQTVAGIGDFLVVHHYDTGASDCWMLERAQVECTERAVYWKLANGSVARGRGDIECFPVVDGDFETAAQSAGIGDLGQCWAAPERQPVANVQPGTDHLVVFTYPEGVSECWILQQVDDLVCEDDMITYTLLEGGARQGSGGHKCYPVLDGDFETAVRAHGFEDVSNCWGPLIGTAPASE